MQTDEPELIAHSIAGDHEAYAQLVDRYKNALYHHCFAIVRDEDAAEDIAQATFIAAYYNLHKYNPNYRLATWLFKIATNKALTYLKKAAKEITADDDLLSTIAATTPSPQKTSEHQELRAAVDQLPSKYRSVISLYYWQGLSYAEVATVMGSPIGTVKVWVKRAKDQLRKELS